MLFYKIFLKVTNHYQQFRFVSFWEESTIKKNLDEMSSMTNHNLDETSLENLLKIKNLAALKNHNFLTLSFLYYDILIFFSYKQIKNMDGAFPYIVKKTYRKYSSKGKLVITKRFLINILVTTRDIKKKRVAYCILRKIGKNYFSHNPLIVQSSRVKIPKFYTHQDALNISFSSNSSDYYLYNRIQIILWNTDHKSPVEISEQDHKIRTFLRPDPEAIDLFSGDGTNLSSITFCVKDTYQAICDDIMQSGRSIAKAAGHKWFLYDDLYSMDYMRMYFTHMIYLVVRILTIKPLCLTILQFVLFEYFEKAMNSQENDEEMFYSDDFFFSSIIHVKSLLSTPDPFCEFLDTKKSSSSFAIKIGFALEYLMNHDFLRLESGFPDKNRYTPYGKGLLLSFTLKNMLNKPIGVDFKLWPVLPTKPLYRVETDVPNFIIYETEWEREQRILKEKLWLYSQTKFICFEKDTSTHAFVADIVKGLFTTNLHCTDFKIVNRRIQAISLQCYANTSPLFADLRYYASKADYYHCQDHLDGILPIFIYGLLAYLWEVKPVCPLKILYCLWNLITFVKNYRRIQNIIDLECIFADKIIYYVTKEYREKTNSVGEMLEFQLYYPWRLKNDYYFRMVTELMSYLFAEKCFLRVMEEPVSSDFIVGRSISLNFRLLNHKSEPIELFVRNWSTLDFREGCYNHHKLKFERDKIVWSEKEDIWSVLYRKHIFENYGFLKNKTRRLRHFKPGYLRAYTRRGIDMDLFVMEEAMMDYKELRILKCICKSKKTDFIRKRIKTLESRHDRRKDLIKDSIVEDIPKKIYKKKKKISKKRKKRKVEYLPGGSNPYTRVGKDSKGDIRGEMLENLMESKILKSLSKDKKTAYILARIKRLEARCRKREKSLQNI